RLRAADARARYRRECYTSPRERTEQRTNTRPDLQSKATRRLHRRTPAHYEIARGLAGTGSFSDPAHGKLLEARNPVVQGWLDAADTLDAQGEVSLAGEVRHFVRHLPRVLTDKEKLAAALVAHL